MALPFLILSTASREAAFASNAGGYRPGGAHRPFAAALSLAIAGGIGATLMLALVIPQFAGRPVDPIDVTNIPVPKPDPVDDPLPDAQPQTTHITTVPRVFDPPTSTEAPTGDIITDPLPPITYIPPDFGSGGGTTIEPPRPPVFRSATRDPRFAGSFQPSYPTSRIREGIEGSCPVTVTIAPNGRVSAVSSAGCADTAFFAATERQAMRSWRFRPATRDGVAVESTQTLTVTFRIDSND